MSFNGSAQTPYGVPLSKIKYPVVNFDPNPWVAFKSCRASDIKYPLYFLAFGIPFVYVTGGRQKKAASVAGLIVSLTAGTMYAIVSSTYRLQGIEENGPEVRKYGSVYTPPPSN